MNIGDVQSMLIGPLIDNTGQVRGVIQMINKDHNGNTQINEDDKKEAQSMLNVLGEILRTADEASELSQLCCCK